MLCAVGAGVMVGSVLPQGGDFPSVLSHSQASLCQKITALLGLGSVPVLQGRTLNHKRKRCWWGGLKKEQSPHSGHCGGMRVVATVFPDLGSHRRCKVGCWGFFPYFLCWFMLSESLYVEHCSIQLDLLHGQSITPMGREKPHGSDLIRVRHSSCVKPAPCKWGEGL